MSAAQATSQGKETGNDEQRLEDSLKKLKELHLKLRNLRTALPRMIEPLATKQSSPQALFDAFTKSVEATNAEIQEFTELLTSDESKEVFTQAEDSRRANPKGIKPWRARDDPGWTSLES